MTDTKVYNIQDSDKLLKMLAIFVYQMISNGAQASQVERQIKSIGSILDVDINCSISLTDAAISIAGTDKTELINMGTNSFNLQKVDELNLATYNLLQNNISLDEYYEQIKQIEQDELRFLLPIRVLGAGMVSLPAALLTQASWITYGIAFILGPIGYLLTNKVGKEIDLPYVDSFFGSMLVTFLACLANTFIPTVPIEVLVICAIMPLVPGTAIVNSIYEIVHNDLMAGLIRLAQAMLAAGSLAIGTMGAITIFKLLMEVIK